jgi:hypothetical protein
LGDATGVVVAALSPSQTTYRIQVDTCGMGTDCGANSYELELEGYELPLSIPVGRRIRVRWMFDSPRGCTQWLVISEAAASDGGLSQGDLPAPIWFVGVDGSWGTPPGVPIEVCPKRLCCNPVVEAGPGCSAEPVDDYALRFFSSSEDVLTLATGETGTLTIRLGSAGGTRSRRREGGRSRSYLGRSYFGRWYFGR